MSAISSARRTSDAWGWSTSRSSLATCGTSPPSSGGWPRRRRVPVRYRSAGCSAPNRRQPWTSCWTPGTHRATRNVRFSTVDNPTIGCLDGYMTQPPPGQQRRLGVVVGHRAVVEPQLEQEAVGLADLAARRDPEDLHDLVAVEVGPDRRQLLLLGEPRDPRLEVVVGAPQPVGLALVAGRAVGPGQDVQPLELVAGVADVAAYGRVGPLARAVAVEAQVQLDQLARPRRSRRWRTAAPASACGSAWRRPRRGGGRSPCRRRGTAGSAACRRRASARRTGTTKSGPPPGSRSSRSIACSSTVSVCS